MPSTDDFVPGLPAPFMFTAILGERIEREGILAVVAVEKADDAVPLVRALRDGGVRVIELAWRTGETLNALMAIKREVPEIILGIGTLLSPDQVRIACAAGADFGVSPSLSSAVLNEARTCGLPFAPGVQTATEIHSAVEQGCRWLKFFPAESAGGLAHLRSVHAPFAHLGLRYIALGGITEESAPDYLRDPAVGAVGGSWIAPASLVKERAWDAIRQRATVARGLVDRERKKTAA